MAPWDELSFFQAPKETFTSNIGGAGNKLVTIAADPLRVLLIFTGSVMSSPVYVTMDSTTPGNKGLAANVTYPIVLTAVDHPTLVQAAWYCNLPVSGLLDVFQVSMIRWPSPQEEGKISDILARAIRSLSQRQQPGDSVPVQ